MTKLPTPKEFLKSWGFIHDTTRAIKLLKDRDEQIISRLEDLKRDYGVVNQNGVLVIRWDVVRDVINELRGE